jgi:hypothetical protein
MDAVTEQVFGKLPASDRETLHRILLHLVHDLDPRPRQEP